MDGEKYRTDTNQNKTGVALLILDRTNFKERNVIRDKEGNYICKRDQFSKKIERFLTCMQTIKLHEQKLIEQQGEMNEYTIIIGDFNTPLS